MREQQVMAGAVKLSSVLSVSVQRQCALARPAPFRVEPRLVFSVWDAQGLEQRGNRAMEAVAECKSQRELARLGDIQLAHQRDVARLRAIEFVIHLEVVSQILP